MLDEIKAGKKLTRNRVVVGKFDEEFNVGLFLGKIFL